MDGNDSQTGQLGSHDLQDVQRLVERIKLGHDDVLGKLPEVNELLLGDLSNAYITDDLSEDVLYAYAAALVSECRTHSILKTKLPKQTKIVCKDFKCTLYCRSAWIEVNIAACHPKIDEIWGDVISCIGIAAGAAGAAALITSPATAWPAFQTSFYACVTAKVGDWGRDIKISFDVDRTSGEWGRC